jgi:hypothetical protein
MFKKKKSTGHIKQRFINIQLSQKRSFKIKRSFVISQHLGLQKVKTAKAYDIDINNKPNQ